MVCDLGRYHNTPYDCLAVTLTVSYDKGHLSALSSLCHHPIGVTINRK